MTIFNIKPMKVKWALLIACVVILIASALLLTVKKPVPEYANYYQPPKTLHAFSLEDHTGKAFNNSSLVGKWSWIFLGYTSCPDVCPTTLQTLAFAYKDLLAVAKNTQIIFVSVDPNRDTIERLNQYIHYFNNDFFALRAEHEQLFPFTQNLSLMYAITESDAKEGYLVDHSASMVLINPKGEIAAIMKPKHEEGEITAVDGKALISDFGKILTLY